MMKGHQTVAYFLFNCFFWMVYAISITSPLPATFKLRLEFFDPAMNKLEWIRRFVTGANHKSFCPYSYNARIPSSPNTHLHWIRW